MNFKLDLNCDNAAFGRAKGRELARILRELAEKIDDARLKPGDDGRLRDQNGHTVGRWDMVDS